MLNAFKNWGKAPKQKIWILFGSETGSSQAIAETLFAAGNNAGFEMHMCTLNEYEASGVFVAADATEKTNLLIVCSTTGDGDPPKNATEFWRFIRKDHAPQALSNINHAVLALGDSNFSKFCHVGKTIDIKMKRWGSTCLQPVTCVDAIDMEKTVEPFIQNIWDRFKPAPVVEDNPNYKTWLRSFFREMS